MATVNTPVMAKRVKGGSFLTEETLKSMKATVPPGVENSYFS